MEIADSTAKGTIIFGNKTQMLEMCHLRAKGTVYFKFEIRGRSQNDIDKNENMYIFAMYLRFFPKSFFVKRKKREEHPANNRV